MRYNFTENEIEERVNNIKSLEENAKKKEDYDFILKKFDIKCKRNGKLLSALYLNLNVKKKIIRMAMDDPEDVFDYDYWMKSQSQAENK